MYLRTPMVAVQTGSYEDTIAIIRFARGWDFFVCTGSLHQFRLPGSAENRQSN